METIEILGYGIPAAYHSRVTEEMRRRSSEGDTLAARRLRRDHARFYAWLDDISLQYAGHPDLKRDDLVVLWRWQTRAKLAVVK